MWLSLRPLFCLFLSGSFTQVLLYFIEEVAKKSKVISDAEKADVHVIDEGFLEAVKRGGAALLISSHSIASWGSDVSYFLAHLPHSDKVSFCDRSLTAVLLLMIYLNDNFS